MARQTLLQDGHGRPAWAWQSRGELRRGALLALSSGGLALMILLAAMVAARRLGGALTTPLVPADLGLLAIGLSSAAMVVRLAARHAGELLPVTPATSRIPQFSAVGWLLMAGPTVALGVTAWALSVPGSSWNGLAALVAMLIVEEAWSVWKVLGGGRRSSMSTAPAEQVAPSSRDLPRNLPARQRPPDGSPRESQGAAAPLSQTPPAEVSQQLSRGRTADGRDECRGFVRAAFAAGQRTETVHMAFCPPFAATPDWSATVVDGPPLSVKHVQLLPYGVRLELRLDKVPDAPVAALLRFAAVERRETAAEP